MSVFWRCDRAVVVRMVFALVVSLLAGCGDALTEAASDGLPDMRECEACIAPPVGAWEIDSLPEGSTSQEQTALVVQPEQVMIYGELERPEDAPPAIVSLSNHTPQHVAITRLYVADHPESLHGEAGAQFFSVAWSSDADADADAEPGHFVATLRAGDVMELRVSMTRTSRQRAALLVIETSHPAFQRLLVPLNGKYFQ